MWVLQKGEMKGEGERDEGGLETNLKLNFDC